MFEYYNYYAKKYGSEIVFLFNNKKSKAIVQNYCFSAKIRYLCMIINIDKTAGI